MIRVFLADDHPVVLDGVTQHIKGEEDMIVVGRAADGYGVAEAAETAQADVLVLDLQMPGVDGARTIAELAKLKFATVVFTLHTDRALMRELFEAGAAATVSKSHDLGGLSKMIRRVAGGETVGIDASGEWPRPPTQLSRREQQIFDGISRGDSLKDIALDLGLSSRTVHTYANRIRAKYGVDDEADRVTTEDGRARNHSLASNISPPPPSVSASLARLGTLWADSVKLSAANVDAGWKLTLERLCEMLDARGGGFATVVTRLGAPNESRSWSVVAALECRSETDGRVQGSNEWAKKKNVWQDGIRVFDGSDRHRVFHLNEGQGDSDSAPRKRLENAGVADRLLGAHVVQEGTEIHFGFDRTLTQESFSIGDRDLLLAALRGLTQTCHWLAVSYGGYPGRIRLSPRERETLGHLLSGKSEKEIAPLMNLKPSSFHQRVVAVYRKLHVQSRAEVMALWLNP